MDFKNPTILCIDDDSEILTLRRLMLESSGYSVLVARSGAEALQILAQVKGVDLILLDYLMPGMNGDEVAERLRQQYPEIPIIAVSAIAVPTAFLSIVDAYVQKGVEPEILLSTIRQFCGEQA